MPEHRCDLAKYRLQNANEKLDVAKLLIDNLKYKDSINRSYYAVFDAMRAVLALDGVDFKKHSAVISHFRQHYIKTGIFNTELSDIAGNAFHIRAQSDYEDFFIVSADEAVGQYEDAKRFVHEISGYLQSKIN